MTQPLPPEVQQRIETHSPRLTLRPSAHGEHWQIVPAEQYAPYTRDDVALDFKITPDGVPYVLSVKNHSGYRGWGTEMVRALAAGFPGCTAWHSTPVKGSGVDFWAKVATERGITEHGITVTGLPDPADAQAHLRKAERDLGAGYFQVEHRDGDLADLDRRVAEHRAGREPAEQQQRGGLRGLLRRLLRS
ncbi:hypothetical protein [Pseudactinotalea terrae]|uniref:hypothetical protein n=1 Tax=Pseudactinotalea terrae TaxID=1743262 RepID=UPI0012E23282|nr:hypothetical protein [Pseudactinotalea terrae]